MVHMNFHQHREKLEAIKTVERQFRHNSFPLILLSFHFFKTDDLLFNNLMVNS
uniref:Uncharacterized protein n=1 Tax=Tetranychus urticae TaxID=32264 RepID=T1JZ17_TETUR